MQHDILVHGPKASGDDDAPDPVFRFGADGKTESISVDPSDSGYSIDVLNVALRGLGGLLVDSSSRSTDPQLEMTRHNALAVRERLSSRSVGGGITMLTGTRTAGTRGRRSSARLCSRRSARGVSIEFAAGEFTAMVRWGSGKSNFCFTHGGSGQALLGAGLDFRASRLDASRGPGRTARRVGSLLPAYNLVPTLHGGRRTSRCRRHRRPQHGSGTLRRGRRHDPRIRDPLDAPPAELWVGDGSAWRLCPRLPARGSCSRTRAHGVLLDSRASQELLIFLEAAVTDRGRTIR